MSLFYVYWFYYKPPPEGADLPEHELHHQPEGEKAIYASQESEARKIYLKSFGLEAGELIRRDPW